MAAIVVNSRVLREKSETIKSVSTTVSRLYKEMLQDVTSTANRMRGTAVETQKKEFEQMQTKFKIFNEDLSKYSTFLTNAAGEYERIEKQGTDNATRIVP